MDTVLLATLLAKTCKYNGASAEEAVEGLVICLMAFTDAVEELPEQAMIGALVQDVRERFKLHLAPVSPRVN